eukprot:2602643-Rhodomonas_salina.1
MPCVSLLLFLPPMCGPFLSAHSASGAHQHDPSLVPLVDPLDEDHDLYEEEEDGGDERDPAEAEEEGGRDEEHDEVQHKPHALRKFRSYGQIWLHLTRLDLAAACFPIPSRRFGC